MAKKGDKIMIPFIGIDKISINKAMEFAKKEYPNAKKHIYIKPIFIEFAEEFECESFWTHPEIQVIF